MFAMVHYTEFSEKGILLLANAIQNQICDHKYILELSSLYFLLSWQDDMLLWTEQRENLSGKQKETSSHWRCCWSMLMFPKKDYSLINSCERLWDYTVPRSPWTNIAESSWCRAEGTITPFWMSESKGIGKIRGSTFHWLYMINKSVMLTCSESLTYALTSRWGKSVGKYVHIFPN